MKAVTAIALSVVLSVPLVAKDKDLAWEPGVLTEQTSEPQCSTRGHIHNGNGSIRERCITVTFYTVDAQDITYTFKREDDDLLAVTVNSRISYATDSKHWYLLDERGKAHKVSLYKKALKLAAAVH